MLKIWKQTWKKGDAVRKPQSDQDSDAQTASMSGASREASPAAGPAHNLGPILPRGRRGTTKRTRTNETVGLDGPNKKPKLHGSVKEDNQIELHAFSDRPTEIIVVYRPSLLSEETRLCKRLHQFDPEEVFFPRHFNSSRLALAEIGSYASDQVWRSALEDIEDTDLPFSIVETSGSSLDNISKQKAKLSICESIKSWPMPVPNFDPSSPEFNVTPKFAKLVQVLKSCRSQDEAFRCIIFGWLRLTLIVWKFTKNIPVHKRAVALAMLATFKTVQEDFHFLRPVALVNQGKSENVELQVSFSALLFVPTIISSQNDIFRKFAQGSYNFLIATKSTEDLDIPKASIVIRYLYQLQYASFMNNLCIIDMI